MALVVVGIGSIFAANRKEDSADYLSALPKPDPAWDRHFWFFKSGGDFLKARSFAFPHAQREQLEASLQRSFPASDGWTETKISSWSLWKQAATGNQMVLTFTKMRSGLEIPVIQETRKASRVQYYIAFLTRHAH